MNTAELIDRLSHDCKPVGRYPMGGRLLAGLLLGGLVTLIAVGAGLGFRPDLRWAMGGATFWIKWLYTGSMTVCGCVATIQLARPDATRLGWLWILLLPVLGLAAIGALEMAQAPSNSWLAMWLGGSWKVCSVLVFLLSLPICVGVLWSFRKFAPTRLRLAGANAGLTAGAWSATVYCLHCPETAAIFVLTWYTLGMALTGLVGSIIGPRLLRW